jgi:DNA modification methylase
MLELNKIYNMDCLKGLKQLPDNSINCCVTSPPYWGLRDYGVEGQFGLEKTPEEYVSKMVEVFREVKRVLCKDGTLWLNLGDSYCGTGNKGEYKDPKYLDGRNGQKVALNNKIKGLKAKDLVGIPWMVAFALRADGWYLRQDIIWHKPNAMPESVKDRCTNAHEYIFLLAKSAQYYYDNEAIKEDAKPESEKRYKSTFHTGKKEISGQGRPGNASNTPGYKKWTGKRNKRSVWTVTTKPFKEAHFATFPPDLIEPCILAGCPAGGVVLDPFMGSGTTGMVAAMYQRNFIGFELNPEYCKMAEKRIEPYLMQQPIFELFKGG